MNDYQIYYSSSCSCGGSVNHGHSIIVIGKSLEVLNAKMVNIDGVIINVKNPITMIAENGKIFIPEK